MKTEQEALEAIKNETATAVLGARIGEVVVTTIDLSSSIILPIHRLPKEVSLIILKGLKTNKSRPLSHNNL